MTTTKLTGVVVPLGALYTKENSAIGEFADLIPFSQFCKSAGLKLIQLLPVNDTGTQSSPYSGLSAFALHPIYIRLKDIPQFQEAYDSDKAFAAEYDSFVKNHPYKNRYDYDGILNSKISLLQKLFAYTKSYKEGKANEELSKFIKANPWVITYAVFKNLKWKYMQSSFKEWLESDRSKTEADIQKEWNTKAFLKDHLFYVWCQMIAANQFSVAVDEVRKNGILLKGDMPILMNDDSCDVWAYPQYFNQELRAGSPSDGENPTGQNWGFPTYNWKNLKTDDYSWWKDRLKAASKYYDAYRLDHILGFFRIWAVPEADVNALNGHTEPYSAIKRDELYELGFDDDRIRWLSKPHIPTSVITDITWNDEVSHKILEILCDRIGNEELWLFKKTVKGSKDIQNCDFDNICDENGTNRIKAALIQYWSNRTLLEVAKNKFVPLWTYGQSTSWKSLNSTEQASLAELFEAVDKKNEKLWRKQADDIFENLTSAVKMIPCGEDLGVGIKCVPETMKKHDILGLRVVRWCRKWEEDGQPYVDFADYEPLSITTTSVHDSSTMRQWLEEDSVFEKTLAEKSESDKEIDHEFTEEKAFEILKACSSSASLWFVPPLQDLLYMNKKYWLENTEDERINVPGTVTAFNWTYRLPVETGDLLKDESLISKIKSIVR